jgi:hypothetical protein
MYVGKLSRICSFHGINRVRAVNPGFGVASLEHLLGVNKLRKLNLWGCSQIGTEIVELSFVLQRNTTLHSLDLAECDITEFGVKTLIDMLNFNTSLSSLQLWWNPVSVVCVGVRTHTTTVL